MRHSRQPIHRPGRSRGLVASLAVMALATVGLVAAATSATATGQHNPNDPSYWEARYAEHDAVCYKHEGRRMTNSHGRLTRWGTAVRLNTFNQAWPGDHWEVLIVKGGAVDVGDGRGNAVYEHPSAGTDYSTPTNGGGRQPGVSHWIVCKGTTPQPTQVEATPPVLTAPTCDAPGTLEYADGEGYTWTADGPDDARTLTAVALEDYILTGDTEYGPYDLTQLTGEVCTPIDEAPEPPETPVDEAPETDENPGLLAETGGGLGLLAIAASLGLIGTGMAGGSRLLRARRANG